MSQSQARDPFLQALQATPFAIDRKRLAAQQIYDDLRERIIGLELKPGTGLSRPALTEFYRVSQTPIRDAILKLEQEGLVEIYPQSKTLVARIDVKNAKETQFLRTAIELEVARALALDSDKMKIAPARRLLDQQREALGRSDLVRFIQFDNVVIELLQYRDADQPMGSAKSFAEPVQHMSPAFPRMMHICFYVRDDVDFNKFIADLEAESARRGMTQVKANRTVTVRTEAARRAAPLESNSNPVTVPPSDGWELIYCKGPEGEQLEFVKVLGPVKQRFAEAFDARQRMLATTL